MVLVALASLVFAAQPVARVDLHAHLTMRRAAQPIFQGEPGHGAQAHAGWNVWTNQVDAQALRAAGVKVVVVALWPPFRLRPGRSELEEALAQLDQLRRFVRDQPDFALALSVADLERIGRTDQIALVPSIEGGEGILVVEDVDRLYAAGARALTLVHFTENALGGAMRLPNGRVFGFPPDTSDWKGLSPLGEAVVRRMISLGMVIDLAHATEALAKQVLEITEAAGVPVILSHTQPWALAPFEPNVSDALAARVAQGGGMIGMLAQVVWVGELAAEARGPGHVLGSCDDNLAQWLHFEEVAGPDAIALGSDFNGFVVRPAPGGACPQGLVTSRGLTDFFQRLRARSRQPSAVDRSADAWRALWRKVEAASSESARREARRKRPEPRSLFDVPL
ncbi:MAG: membrane dipeptidase [Myxococcota bacterium]|nr:membrane dipeptidase [Myxococcota bacterium]